MVKLGVILLVKLNSAYWRQRLTTGAFARQKFDEIDPKKEEMKEIVRNIIKMKKLEGKS
jgi:hypothetical protein